MNHGVIVMVIQVVNSDKTPLDNIFKCVIYASENNMCMNIIIDEIKNIAILRDVKYSIIIHYWHRMRSLLIQ